MKNILCLCSCIAFLLLSGILKGQHQDASCGTSKSYEKYLKEHPEEKAKMEKTLRGFLKEASKFMEAKSDPNSTYRKSGGGNYIIPVVFHNIYGSREGIEFIVEDDAINAIARLNQDFSGVTADLPNNPDCTGDTDGTLLELDCDSPLSLSTPGIANIQFRLAEKDTCGNPTNGITYTKSHLSYLSLGDGPILRDIIQWDRDKYLNIYIVYASNGASSGVAQYPLYTDDKPGIDGVAMPYWSFKYGPEHPDHGNFASTITHEVGHWLGLRHIWGADNAEDRCDSDDFGHLYGALDVYLPNDPDYQADPSTWNDFIEMNFNDTPNCKEHGMQSGVCEVRDGADEYCGVDYYYDNFMDYTPCMRTFSPGQVNYMECVLNNPLSQRNEIQDNLANTLYYDPISGNDIGEPRVVFTDTNFEESPCVLGSIYNELPIRLEYTLFDARHYVATYDPDPYLNSSFYEITLPESSLVTIEELMPEVEIVDGETAILRLKGMVTNLESIEGIEFKFNMQGYTNEGSGPYVLFTTAPSEINRIKKLNLQKYEDITSGYADICPNFKVGPNGLHTSFFQIAGQYYYLDYKAEKGRVNLGTGGTGNLEFCIHNPAGTGGELKTFIAGQNIDIGSGIYTTKAYSIFDPTNGSSGAYVPHPTLGSLDLNDLTWGEDTDSEGYFYIGLRYNLHCNYKYGWLRLQLVNCEGEIDVIVHDFKFDDSIGSPAQTGHFTQPVLTFSASTFEESLNNDNTFEESIKIKLEGTSASFNAAINGASSLSGTPYFDVVGPNSDNLDFRITSLSGDAKEIELSLLNPNNVSSLEDELYTIDFDPSAFSSSLSNIEISCEGGIVVDYYHPYQSDGSVDGEALLTISDKEPWQLAGEMEIYAHDQGFFNDDLAINAQLNLFVDLLDNVASTAICEHVYDSDDNGSYQITGDMEPGYIVYMKDIHLWQGEFLCKPSSQEIVLLKAGELPSDYIGTGTGEFVLGGDGGYSEQCGPSFKLEEDVYLPSTSLSAAVSDPTYTNDEGYIALRLTKDCNEVYYAWVKVDLSDDEPKFDVFYYAFAANTPILMGDFNGYECAPLLLYDDGWYVAIDNVILNGENGTSINNIGTGFGGVALSDFSNLTVELNKNQAYLITLNELSDLTLENPVYWDVWINWDRDPFFEHSESVLNDDANEITIPADIEDGIYTMRIRCVRDQVDSDGNGCGSFAYGEVEDYTIIIGDVPTSTHFDIKMCLEGAYRTDLEDNDIMIATLASSDLLPASQPYNVAPYLYPGTESVTSFNPDIVDWVLIEARTGTPNLIGNPGTTIVERKVGLLRTDGQVVDPSDQVSPLKFYELDPEQEYHIVARHRNHLDIISANAYSPGDVVDLTTNVGAANGPQQLKQLAPSVFGLISGDFNQDGIIQVSDYYVWFQSDPAGIDVYVNTDANLDGVLQANDYDYWFRNKAYIGSIEIAY